MIDFDNPWVIAVGTGVVLLIADRIVAHYFQPFRNWISRNPWVQTALISLIVASAVGFIMSKRPADGLKTRIVQLEAQHPHEDDNFMLAAATERDEIRSLFSRIAVKVASIEQEQGTVGPKGPIGARGNTGEPGPQGALGLPGQKGDPGLKGPQGVAGSQGEKGDPGPKGESSAAPIGAVVAFDLPNGCPESWLEFTPAGGRFIVGVNGGTYKLPYVAGKPDYQKDGAETHKLSESHLPDHMHKYLHTPDAEGRDGSNKYLSAAGRSGHVTEIKTDTEATGSLLGKPVDHMPPFIALYFCKYEGS